MYASLETLINLFGQENIVHLSDRDGSGEINEAVVNDALLRAGSEVDSYLAGRCHTPLAEPVPPVVGSVVCDIARYRLSGGDASETDPIVIRYEKAVQWLRDVGAGKADIPGLAPAGADSEGVLFHAGERPWEGIRL